MASKLFHSTISVEQVDVAVVHAEHSIMLVADKGGYLSDDGRFLRHNLVQALYLVYIAFVVEE